MPLRTCLGCRETVPQEDLIRLVRVGDEMVDATRPRLPGRGGYLHPGCLELAERRRALTRAFGSGAVMEPGLRERLAGWNETDAAR